ncbi:MAG: hypothetical protein HY454_02135 [Parcubacteria group bacterium]|nr:hypothetical protein [Parcubacteria group bacterium]
MSALLNQLGIDGKLLLAQGVNFAVVLVALTFLVYKPLVKLLNERRAKIETGLKNAAAAQKRLEEIDALKAARLAEAEKEALAVIIQAEKEAGQRAQEITAGADLKADAILKEAQEIAEHKKQLELQNLASEAKVLIKQALAKAVSAQPQEIDERLINQAAEFMRQSQ